MFNKKSKSPAPPLKQVADAEDRLDDLGPYPTDVNDSPTKEKAQLTVMRSVALVAAVSGCVNVVLATALMTVMPLQKVYPFLVTFKSQDNQVVRIEPLEANAEGMAFATEANIRSYITERHSFTPNKSVMEKQWGADSKLAAMSGEQLFTEFKKASDNELSQMLSAGYTRIIEVNSVIQVSENVWQVDFTTADSLGGQGGTLTANPSLTGGLGLGAGNAASNATAAGQTSPAPSQSINPLTSVSSGISVPETSRRKWTAKLQVEYQPQRITYDRRLLNPLGFTVVAYSVTNRS